MLDGDGVEGTVIQTETKRAIWLGCKNYWGTERGCGGADPSMLKVPGQLLLHLSQFCRRHSTHALHRGGSTRDKRDGVGDARLDVHAMGLGERGRKLLEQIMQLLLILRGQGGGGFERIRGGGVKDLFDGAEVKLRFGAAQDLGHLLSREKLYGGRAGGGKGFQVEGGQHSVSRPVNGRVELREPGLAQNDINPVVQRGSDKGTAVIPGIQ